MSAAVLRRASGAFTRFGTLGIFALVGCSDTSSESVASSARPILNGQVSTTDEDMVVEVVSREDTVTHTCTGTLLAPNVVITARHCIAAYTDATFTCTSDGELAAGSKGGKMGAPLDPSRITIRTGTMPPLNTTQAVAATATKVFATQATSICRNDIAVVVIDPPLTAFPIAPVRVNAGVERGENLRVVGYGVDDMNKFGTRHTRSGLTVTLVGSSQFRAQGDAVPPRTFVTEGPALCIGDSGGPSFSEQGAVVGVWSQVVGACTAESARNYFTEVAPFADELLVPAFKEAGADIWVEGTSGPGATGSGGSASGGALGMAGAAGSGDVGGFGGLGGSESGGSSSTGGSVGIEGGASATGGTTVSGGSSDIAGSAGTGGLRKKGGCTCNTPGANRGGSAWLAAPLLALGLLARRRQAGPRRALGRAQRRAL